MKVSFFNQLYIVLCTASLISCANVIPIEESSKVIVPELHILIPEWPDNLGFWSGVKTETLVWKSKKREEVRIPAEEWLHSAVDLSTGGVLSYEGWSENKTLLLYGELEIEAWTQLNQEPKKFLLEIHRVDFE